jgi:hypothetical protein
MDYWRVGLLESS